MARFLPYFWLTGRLAGIGFPVLPTPVTKFNVTAHFKQRQSERALSTDAAKDVVKYCQGKIKQCAGQHGGHTFKFNKTVDGYTLTVVAELKGTECWLISGYKNKNEHRR